MGLNVAEALMGGLYCVRRELLNRPARGGRVERRPTHRPSTAQYASRRTVGIAKLGWRKPGVLLGHHAHLVNKPSQALVAWKLCSNIGE